LGQKFWSIEQHHRCRLKSHFKIKKTLKTINSLLQHQLCEDWSLTVGVLIFYSWPRNVEGWKIFIQTRSNFSKIWRVRIIKTTHGHESRNFAYFKYNAWHLTLKMCSLFLCRLYWHFQKESTTMINMTNIAGVLKRSHFLPFLLSIYEIWKVLVSLANFHVLGLFIPKKRV
jgi:hypothetical protein